MKKPINIEAERVLKVIGELLNKVEVVSLLSSELFQSVLAHNIDLEEAFSRDIADLQIYYWHLM